MGQAIDAEQISMLVDGTGVEGVMPILDAYWESNDQLIAQLKDALAAGDTNAVATTAHGLKGSSANLGATLMAERAREIELAAKGNDLDAARAACAKLDDDIAAVRQAFDEILATKA
ncbi:MAG: Hpt domain-containing protein [Pseudomonadota bacterium]